MDLRRSTGIHRRLAEYRAQICLIGLKEIQKYWKINKTVLDLFFKYLDDATAKRLHFTEDGVPRSPDHDTSPSDMNFTARRKTTGGGSGNPNLAPAYPNPPAQHGLAMPSLDYMVDGLPNDFFVFTDSNMYMDTGLDMLDLDLLQRCL